MLLAKNKFKPYVTVSPVAERFCNPRAVVFSETRANTGYDPLERSPRKAKPRSHKRTIGLNPTTNQPYIT